MSEVSRLRPLRESSSGASRRVVAASAATGAGEAAVALQLAAAALHVAAQRGRRLVAQGDDPHLAALAAHDELGLCRLDVAKAQRHELHAAQTAAVEQLENEAVAQRERVRAFCGGDERVHVRHAEHARQTPAPARPRQAARRIGGEHAGLGEVPREAAKRRELARQRGRCVPAPAEIG